MTQNQYSFSNVRVLICIALQFLVFTLFWGCTKEPEPEDCVEDTLVSLHIGDSMLSKIPHTGYDTMVFFNQYGDTIFLIGKGVDKFTIKGTAPYDKGKCGYVADFMIDFERLKYSNDTTLSNTNKPFLFSNILISADSNNEFWQVYQEYPNDEYSGGISIPLEGVAKPRTIYNFLNNQYYTESITIDNITYKCLALYKREGFALYYNHYQGIIQLVENDSIIWNRKLVS